MAVISQKLFNGIMLSGTPLPLFRITLLRNVCRSYYTCIGLGCYRPNVPVYRLRARGLRFYQRPSIQKHVLYFQLKKVRTRHFCCATQLVDKV